jgi:hypothetical protein
MGVGQLSLGVFHLPGVVCPMLHVLGVPCPGCGATRACAAMLRGDWHAWLKMHALAPVFLVAVGLFAVASVLPSGAREPLVRRIEAFERRTGVSTLALAALIVYWLARLAIAPHEFIRLMKG